jgi:hypothetical protein
MEVTEQVLHPRTLGFTSAMTVARDHIDALWDVTFSYVDYEPGERPSELSILKGAWFRPAVKAIRRRPLRL